MKKIALLIVASATLSYAKSNFESTTKLKKYKPFLIEHTYVGQNWSRFNIKPKSRYFTFKKVFEWFEQNNGKVIVELGTSRSFVHGGLIGCNSDDPKYWTPNNPKNWDWGAGAFTRVASECLAHLNPTIHTVDIAAPHINRCKLITQEYKKNIRYHVASSVNFLKTLRPQSVDVIYMDTGNIDEHAARLHLAEAKVIVRKNILKPNGIILIDDVRNQNFKRLDKNFNSDFGKAKYSIPYLLEHGYEIVADEYQVILIKK